MTDRIIVDRIAIYARHGLLPEEEAIGQRFYVSLVAGVDTRAAGRSDDMADSVSYADMAHIAVEVGTERRFRLIEALAETIAGEILRRLPRVETIRVRVDKPSAPVAAIIDGVSVEIERSRGD